MNLTKDNIYKHEFVGLTARVIAATDQNWIGRSGPIVDETKNTFKLEIDGKEKMLPKYQTVLAIKINEKVYKVDATQLRFRPEDRIKKVRKGKAVT
jgi:ribonuclease P protein subunit POP4